MDIPEPLRRYPTRAAIDSLAARFDLPSTPHMQDWEWEVADPARIDEFLAAYLSGELTEDERFTLMETIIQSFEELPADLASDVRWKCVLEQLDVHFELHGCTVWYWSVLHGDLPDEMWCVTPWLRAVLERNRERLVEAPARDSL